MLIEVLTAPLAVVIDALSYLWSAFLLSRIRAPETPAVVDAAPSVLGDILIGLRACLAHPLIGPALIADSVMGFFSGFFFALYMLLALEALVLSPATVGIIISVGGIGAFVGTMIAPRWVVSTVRDAHGAVPRPGPSRDLLIPLALDGGALAIPLLVLQQLVGDAFLVAYVIHAISLRQRVLPPAVLGRANATFHVIPGLLLPAGAWWPDRWPTCSACLLPSGSAPVAPAGRARAAGVATRAAALTPSRQRTIVERCVGKIQSV